MVLLILISILYFIVIISFIIGFDKVIVLKKRSVKQRFSILIPFRNEAENIAALAKSLQVLNYPKEQYEIIWINDASTDNSVPILTEFIIKNNNWKLVDNKRQSNSPKKDAIQTAIYKAKYKWIITTDADCEVPINWLQSFSGLITSLHAISKEVNMIAAPVAYKTEQKFLQNFQNMDFLSLIGSTIGSFGIGKPFMCNGANLCYRKEIFFEVNGFQGNDNIASGDDVFLLEKIQRKKPKSVHYLKSKDALVITKPETTFKGLILQRIRWASKTSATKNRFGKSVGIIVFLMNFILVFGVIYSFFNLKYLNTVVLIFVLKFNIDFLLIHKTYRFVGLKNNIKSYIGSSFLYPFFVVYIVLLSFFKKSEWKK